MAASSAIVAYLVVFAFVFSCSSNLVFSQCHGTALAGLIEKCGQSVIKSGPKTPPSPTCCDDIKKVDLPCICSKVITPKLETLIDIQKIVYVADFCGKPIPHGTKCGSVTIPSF